MLSFISTSQAQGKLAEAEEPNQRALAIREKALGPDHPDVAQSLNNLALLLWQLERHGDAIPFQERATAIQESRGDPDAGDYRGELDGLRKKAPYPYGN